MPTITTTSLGDGAFASLLGRHRIVTDVPPDMGGEDRGPEPAQLFVASLGACVAAIVQAYCAAHDLDGRDLRVEVDYHKTGEPSRLQQLLVRIAVPHADMSSDRLRTVIQRVAEHCPVHETISTLDAIRFEFEGERGAGATD